MNRGERGLLAQAVEQGMRDDYYGDETGLAENLGAATELFLSEDLSTSQYHAERDMVDSAMESLYQATGDEQFSRLSTKLHRYEVETGHTPEHDWQRRRDILAKQTSLIEQLRQQNPGLQLQTISEIEAVRNKAATGVRKRAQSVAARQTGGGSVGEFLGMAYGAMHDPINQTTMMLGAPSAALRGGSILMNALKVAGYEGAIAGMSEAAIQPTVYGYKRQLGVPYTGSDAATNILAAAFGGAVIGGSVQAGGQGIAALYRRATGEGGLHPTPDTEAAAQVIEDIEVTGQQNPLTSEQAHFEAVARAAEQQGHDMPVDVDDIVSPHLPPTEGVPSLEAVDPRTVGVDAERFQFKAGGDAAGVTNRLQGVSRWEPELAGVSIIWEDTAGKRWIVDGHQRLGLANRLAGEGADNIALNAIVFREADGVSAREATARAAIKNIAEGTGTAVDAAKLLRSMGDQVQRMPELPPQSQLVRDAQDLAQLGDESFRAVINGVVPDRYAAIVGRMVDGDAEQLATLSVLAKAEPANKLQAEAMVRDVRAGGFHGGEQDLFGDAPVETLYKERAQVVDHAMRHLRRDKRVFKTLTDREADILGHGTNQLDSLANRQRLSADQAALSTLMADANTKGPISDAVNEAARAVRGGASPAKAAKAVTDALRDQDGFQRSRIETELDSLPPDVDRPPVTPPDHDAISIKVVEGDGKRWAEVVIDRDKIDRDQPNFGYPDLPKALDDADPLLIDTQQRYQVDGAYMPERAALHEQWIASALEGKAPVAKGERPVAVLMGGGGASGKGSVLRQQTAAGVVDAKNSVHIDPDEIKQLIPEHHAIEQAGDYRAASVVHEESSDIAKELQRRAIEGRYSVVIDKTLGNPEKGLQLIQNLHDAGYEVRLTGVTVDASEAMIRALERYYNSGRLPVPGEMVKAHQGFNAAFEQYARAADGAQLFDNTGAEKKLLANAHEGELLFVDEAAYTKAVDRGNINVHAKTLRQLDHRGQAVAGVDAKVGQSNRADDSRGMGEAGNRGDDPGAQAESGRQLDSGTVQRLTDDLELNSELERLFSENPNRELPDLEVTEDGVEVVTRRASDVFQELDDEAVAVRNVIDCMGGGDGQQ